MNYLNFNGYRVKVAFAVNRENLAIKAKYISLGQLCKRESNSDNDRWVQVYHLEGIGYGYINEAI